VVAAMLVDLQLCPNDRVMIMLPDGPGFAEVITGVIRHGAVSLSVNPQLSCRDIRVVAADAAAHLVLTSVDRLHVLAELDAEPPVLVDGPDGPWIAALRLR
jgi:acyl-coenzyme A synthetase/AMP-(fatty) acid ligase